MAEEILVRQGAPTLAGIKTGSLFPCPCEDREVLLSDIRKLNRRLSPKGLCLLPIRFLAGQALLYSIAPLCCGGICGTSRHPRCCGRRATAMRAARAAWRGLPAASAKAKSSPMRWGCFSAIRRRT